MLIKVISGFQTGADMGGILAARRRNFPTGGWMPAGFRAEDGLHPEYAELYGAREHRCRGYRPRTLANIQESDAVWIFAVDPESPGSYLTVTEANRAGIPSVVIVVNLGEPILPARPPVAANWLMEKDVRTLMVAGNRESKAPGIGDWVFAYLMETFRIIKEQT